MDVCVCTVINCCSRLSTCSSLLLVGQWPIHSFGLVFHLCRLTYATLDFLLWQCGKFAIHFIDAYEFNLTIDQIVCTSWWLCFDGLAVDGTYASEIEYRNEPRWCFYAWINCTAVCSKQNYLERLALITGAGKVNLATSTKSPRKNY